MLLSMSSQDIWAAEYLSTSGEVAGRCVGIDDRTSGYHCSGNGKGHRRSSEHAGSIGRQCHSGRHAGSGGQRELIEACHSFLRIDGC